MPLDVGDECRAGPGPVPGGWVLISYSVPNQPSAIRVASWRALRDLGAAKLGHALYALPATEEHIAALRRVAERINGGGGSSMLFVGQTLDEAAESSLRERFIADRTDEYLQAARGARRFVEHVHLEESTNDYRFAEVDSLEEELEKVRRQFERAARRDHLGAPAREEGRAALIEAESALRQYVEAAYRNEEQR